MPEYIFEASRNEFVLFTTTKGPEFWENVIFAREGETVYLSHTDWNVIAKFLVVGFQVTHLDNQDNVVDVVCFENRTDLHTFPVAGGIIVQLADL